MKTLVSIALLAISAVMIIPTITTVTTVDEMTSGLDYVYKEPPVVLSKKQKVDSLKKEVSVALKQVNETINK